MSILVLTSDTLIGTPATGNLEYNGQFYGTDSNASRAQMQRITQGTAVASTSGTSIDFTGLPAWVKRITVIFNVVSTNGTSTIQVQIGSSAGIVTSGYSATNTGMSSAVASSSITTGFPINGGVADASNVIAGNLILTNLTGNTWVSSHAVQARTSTAACAVGGGVSPSLPGVLDRVRITTVNGTDTFDAGSINILYEG